MNEMKREQGDINTSGMRNIYWERNLSPEAKKLIERDAKCFLHQNLSTPVMNVLSKTDGIYIYDTEGKKYIDMHGNGVHNAGFNNDYIIQKVIAALLAKTTFTPRRYTNIQAIEFAEKLISIAPEGLSRVLFAPGGSEAIEMAVMLAKQITGRWKTISFWDSYHGNGFQASSIGGEELFKGGNGPMVPGAYHVEFPNYYRNPWNFTTQEEVDNEILRQMEILFEKEGEIACLIGEPITSTPLIPSKNFWHKVKKLCEKHGALLIFDEIIEGFGKTGKFFACEHYVTPDILVLGKSFGGGLVPFAGIITKEEYNVLQNRSIGHFTHEKNGLCSVAGLAAIEYLTENKLVERAAETGKKALSFMQEMEKKHPLIGNVNGIGLHLGIELVKDRITKEKAVDEAESVMYMAMERGVAFKVIESNVITMRPSLMITSEEMIKSLEIIDECIGAVEKGIKYK